MLLNLIQTGITYGFEGESFRWALISVLLSLPIIMLSLCVHETAHGWVAYKLGDPTAKDLGRLTLNPLKHLNPIGFIAMLTIGIGWANPVPINARHFKNPRVGMALSGIAGPVSNLLMALVSYTLYMLTCFFMVLVGAVGNPHVAIQVLLIFLDLATYLNLALALFNLIPVPPFDGSRFMYIFLPTKWYFKVMKYERYTGIVLIVILLVLSRMNIHPIDAAVRFIMDLMEIVFSVPLNLLLSLILS